MNNQEQYLPRPLWDDEAVLSRNPFATYDQAEDHVAELGGKLLEDKKN